VPAKRAAQWRFVVSAPPREVFAVMEQMIGTPPYRYEVIDENSARVVEFSRNSLVGHWRSVADRRTVMGRERPAVRNQRWVHCRAVGGDAGTVVELEASAGRGALPRALQLIGVISRGVNDQRTIYRSRHIPPGPVTLVASWAGMAYPLFVTPSHEAARGMEVLTASRVEAIPGGTSGFVRVRLSDGTEGYIERDQVVSAPAVATRDAGFLAARNV
jgi:hypothetical protein